LPPSILSFNASNAAWRFKPTSTPMLDVCARLRAFKVEQCSRSTLWLKTCEGSDIPLSLIIQQESNARINPPPGDSDNANETEKR
ncbi:MAG TPA: hypothetical protein VFQ47_05500, partial [Nitrososphaera sp.]|nr:hypothetical protein [Nitrososphaera sp.]